MKKAYPVFISQSGEDYLVYVPDMDIYTEGKDFVDAIEVARDAMGLQAIALEEVGRTIPEPSEAEVVYQMGKTDIYDYTQGTLTYVDVDFTEYKRRNDNRMVRRNVTLPNWMNVEAEKAHLNVSKVLQEALAERLQM